MRRSTRRAGGTEGTATGSAKRKRGAAGNEELEVGAPEEMEEEEAEEEKEPSPSPPKRATRGRRAAAATRTKRKKEEDEEEEGEEEADEQAPAKRRRAAPRRKATKTGDASAGDGEDDREIAAAAAAAVTTRTSSRLRSKAEAKNAPPPPPEEPSEQDLWDKWRSLTRAQRNKWMRSGKPVPQRPGTSPEEVAVAQTKRATLERAASFSKNDLLNSSYLDLFGLLQRRVRASSSSSGEDQANELYQDKWLVNPETGEFEDRWILLNHHHWAVSYVQKDGYLRTAEEQEEAGSDDKLLSYRPFRARSHKPAPQQGPIFEQKKRLAKGTLQDEVEDAHDDYLPLYLDPPDDGTCCIADLPIEILLHIFSYLPSGALARGMNVCRTWWDVLHDHQLWNEQCVVVEARGVQPADVSSFYHGDVQHVVFAFREPTAYWEEEVDSKEVTVHSRWGDVSYNPSMYGFGEESGWSSTTKQRAFKLKSLGREKPADLGYIKIEQRHSWRDFPVLLNGLRYGEFWWFKQYQIRASHRAVEPGDNKPKPFHNPDLWRWRLVLSDENELTGFVQFNIGYFERLVKEGRATDELSAKEKDFLVTLIKESYYIDTNLYEQQTIPTWLQLCKKREEEQRKQKAEERRADGDQSVVATVENKPYRVDQPESINVQLYSYQRETLTWMKEVEEMVSRGLGWEIVHLLSWEDRTGSRVMFDQDGNIFAPSTLKKDPHIRTLMARGGMLADEMGLGKTLVVLSLIALQKAKADKIILRDDQMSPLDENTFRTKATLVVCPNHLCKQWESEIKKHTNPRLKAHVVNTVRAHEKISYKDVLNADVVIVSFTFLSNNIYLNTRPSCTPAMVKNQESSDFDPLRSFAPVFHQFRWLRIVLDEGHEVMTDSEGEPIFNVMGDYQSVFRWYVTGTPFMAGVNSLRGVLSYLQVRLKEEQSKSYLSSRILSPIIERGALRNLYCRHTKASVGNEYSLPGVEEEVILIRHSPIEKTLYEVAHIEGREKEMYQLCSHPQISNNQCRVVGSEQVNLKDIFAQVLSYKEDQIAVTEKELISTKKDLKKHQKGLAKIEAEFQAELRKNPNWKPSRIQNSRKHGRELSVRREKALIPRLEKSLAAYRQSLETLQKMNRKLNSSNGEDEEEEAKVEEKEKEEDEKEEKSTVANITNAHFMTEEEEVDEELIQQYGSKMAHVYVHVKKLCEDEANRLIIFSQWDRMLGHVGEILEKNGIPTVSCRGNVHRRNKAISAFQDANTTNAGDKPRVLMLSLESAASGTNLTGATHVLLLDPISGSAKRARAIEAQAIGRAHRLGQTKKVKVVRFIVVNTVEFDAYINNYCSGASDTEDNAHAAESGGIQGLDAAQTATV